MITTSLGGIYAFIQSASVNPNLYIYVICDAPQHRFGPRSSRGASWCPGKCFAAPAGRCRRSRPFQTIHPHVPIQERGQVKYQRNTQKMLATSRKKHNILQP